MELQNRVPNITSYKQLCDWVADSLTIKRLYWPLYFSDELGSDSTGGTTPAPYVELCYRGYLTVDSQDGFSDEYELQYSYVSVLVPQRRLQELVARLATILDEVDVYLNHSQQLKRSMSGEVNWLPLLEARALTLGKDDVTSEFHIHSRIAGSQEFNEADILISAIEVDHWRSATGYEFPPALVADLRRQELQTLIVVMRRWGTYMADGSGTAAVAVLSVID